jgi:hypothetical protein
MTSSSPPGHGPFDLQPRHGARESSLSKVVANCAAEVRRVRCMRSRSASLTWPTQRYWSHARAGTSSSTTATSAVTPETRRRRAFMEGSLARENRDKSRQIKHLTSLTNALPSLNV